MCELAVRDESQRGFIECGQGDPYLSLTAVVCLQWTTGAYDYIQYLQNSIPK